MKSKKLPMVHHTMDWKNKNKANVEKISMYEAEKLCGELLGLEGAYYINKEKNRVYYIIN